MAVASTGFFDGVHIGHRAVIRQLVNSARQLGQKSIVITFWPHPRSILHQDAGAVCLLSSMDEKRALIKSLGVDDIVVFPFTKDFSRLTTKEFLMILKTEHEVSHLIIGYDHRVGCDGNAVSLESVCNDVGIVPVRVSERTSGQEHISATIIREALSMGDVARASRYLGYCYSLRGVVISGDKIGRKIGFPTANIRLYDSVKVVPGNGVYVVDVEIDSRHYTGICNIGARPTVSEVGQTRIETHILEFDEDIYGHDLQISFLEKMRNEYKFPSLDALKEQIKIDKETALKKKHFLSF